MSRRAVLAERERPVGFEVHRIGQHQHRGGIERSRGDEIGDQAFGAFAHPVVDRLDTRLGCAGEVERDHVGAVLFGEEVDPFLVGLDPDTGPIRSATVTVTRRDWVAAIVWSVPFHASCDPAGSPNADSIAERVASSPAADASWRVWPIEVGLNTNIRRCVSVHGR